MAKKILLADDSITIQKVVELTFSDGDYEVTAVNNGAKAIQKLTELRPDIILSDIIMPEKNGYEVCEFVKSHPDFRNIPVVLLTGTFEPFDPDRADKAGCDAVVTKPFESQSLIHKVEELIEQSRSASPAPPSAPAPAEPETTSAPWDQPPAAPAAASSFTEAAGGFTAAPAFTPAPEPPAPSPFTHDTDIFNAAPHPAPASEMPIEAPAESPFGSPESAFAGETKAFPRMSFDELSNMTPTQEVPAPAPESSPAPSPWDEQPPMADHHQFAQPAFEEKAPEAEPAADLHEEAESPFGAPPPVDDFRTDTRAFPRMNFEDLNAAASQAAPAAPPAAEAPAASPWDEPPAFSGETKAFPRMSFEDLQAAASQVSAAPETTAPWGEPAPPPAPAWSQPEETPAEPAAEVASAFEEPAAAPFAPASEPEPAAAPAWSAPEPAPAAAPQAASGALELNDEQIDRIARRVVQLMSDQVVRNIAWEVIPDLAEMVVKERIRQLEAEA